jgi:DNA-binding response OmpR family regulator
LSQSDDGQAEKGRILLVEDNEGMALMYRRGLQHGGYAVTVARDGWEGLREIRTRNYDLVLLDLGLPGMDGLSVLTSVRQESDLQQLPVVVITNYSEPHTINRALELGALEYLIKTNTSPATLAERVEGWLKQPPQAG